MFLTYGTYRILNPFTYDSYFRKYRDSQKKIITRIFDKLQRVSKKSDISRMPKDDLIVKICGGVRNKDDCSWILSEYHSKFVEGIKNGVQLNKFNLDQDSMDRILSKKVVDEIGLQLPQKPIEH